MLILTRRINERLIIANDIEVIVLGIKGNQVRLGINAPEDVPVHREEIQQKIELEAQGGLTNESTKVLYRRSYKQPNTRESLHNSGD